VPETLYQHDVSGRLLRSVETPEWDDEQRAWMLALAEIEADACPGCGGSISEHGEDEWGRAQHLYDVTANQCFRCTAIQDKQANVKDHPAPSALLWSAAVRDTTRGR